MTRNLFREKFIRGMWVRFQRFQYLLPTDVTDSERIASKIRVSGVSYQYKYIQVIKIGSDATLDSLKCTEFSTHRGNVCFLIRTLASWV